MVRLLVCASFSAVHIVGTMNYTEFYILPWCTNVKRVLSMSLIKDKHTNDSTVARLGRHGRTLWDSHVSSNLACHFSSTGTPANAFDLSA
ncbi:hypothetical protein EV702DRAFT_434446 [Suillus placidus]|uniref:Secreted protein n=1 Tax=Suillus placidus TaxID=48579 RepID=A0A9P6ZSP6_9AGAM|nr:hypothetical protein EV702DRAFT_434446 [Suillus placidus]